MKYVVKLMEYLAFYDDADLDDSKRVAGEFTCASICDKYSISREATIVNIGTVAANGFCDDLTAGHHAFVAFVIDSNVGYGWFISTATVANEHLVVGLEHGVAVIQVG